MEQLVEDTNSLLNGLMRSQHPNWDQCDPFEDRPDELWERLIPSDVIKFSEDNPTVPTDGGFLTSEAEILRVGPLKFASRTLDITPEFFDMLIHNFDQGARGDNPLTLVRKELPITQDHDFGAAVGWTESLRQDGVSLFAKSRWNKYGAEAIINQRYRYASIEFVLDWEDAEGKQYGPTLFGWTQTNFARCLTLRPLQNSQKKRKILLPSERRSKMADEETRNDEENAQGGKGADPAEDAEAPVLTAAVLEELGVETEEEAISAVQLLKANKLKSDQQGEEIKKAQEETRAMLKEQKALAVEAKIEVMIAQGAVSRGQLYKADGTPKRLRLEADEDFEKFEELVKDLGFEAPNTEERGAASSGESDGGDDSEEDAEAKDMSTVYNAYYENLSKLSEEEQRSPTHRRAALRSALDPFKGKAHEAGKRLYQEPYMKGKDDDGPEKYRQVRGNPFEKEVE